MIVGGTDRPWRTICHTGITFLLEKGVLQTHWEPFNEVARYWPYLEERCTINKLWNKEVGLFGPLVPLTYHLWEDHPFYPVGELWQQNGKKSSISDNSSYLKYKERLRWETMPTLKKTAA
jgi:hypothetical protein